MFIYISIYLSGMLFKFVWLENTCHNIVFYHNKVGKLFLIGKNLSFFAFNWSTKLDKLNAHCGIYVNN